MVSSSLVLRNYPLLTWISRETASKITLQQRQISKQKLDIFRKWFKENVIQLDAFECPFVVIPCAVIKPQYRQETNDPTFQ